jgi:hypothetical protein
MEDKEYQMKNLEAIYVTASLAPVFKLNTKFCVDQFAGHTPYIAYADIMDRKFVIRATSDYTDKSEANPVIAEYVSIEDLVNDGWRLD